MIYSEHRWGDKYEQEISGNLIYSDSEKRIWAGGIYERACGAVQSIHKDHQEWFGAD